MRRALVTPAVFLAATLACAEPLELAEWRIDVAAGTPIIELPGVPLEERDVDRQAADGDEPVRPLDTRKIDVFERPFAIPRADDVHVLLGNRLPRPRHTQRPRPLAVGV